MPYLCGSEHKPEERQQREACSAVYVKNTGGLLPPVPMEIAAEKYCWDYVSSFIFWIMQGAGFFVNIW